MNARMHTTHSSAGTLFALGLSATMASGAFAQAARPEVIGYLPSWKWNSGKALSNPATIPYDKFTVIDYAFFAPLPDGRIAGRNPAGDERYLKCDGESTLVAFAHRHGVKVLLSIGGWGDSQNFPVVAAKADLRAAFSHSCVQAMRDYGFDGIDIDWEFPGYTEHGGGPADRENFTLLLSTLRDSLDAFAGKAGNRALLTAALPAWGENLRNMDVRAIAPFLDQINIMTYDYHGVWDSLAGHNSPLYPSAGSDTGRCLDASFRYFRDSCGVSPARLNIGVPFYGHTFTQCVALNTTHGGEDTMHFSGAGAVFSSISQIIDRFERHWDPDAQVPYLVQSEWKVLVSYDDEESVRAKARYLLENRIHGIIIWEITGDNMPDGRTPLLDALTTTLRGASPSVH